MKLSKKLLAKYNSPDTVLVLTTYPRKGHTIDPKALAVAPVAKNTLRAISDTSHKLGKPVKFVIIADSLENESAYEEDGHLIIRSWLRNEASIYFTIQKIINLFPKAKILMIEHEFGIFGLKNIITAQFPGFLLTNKLQGRRIILILHQVIFDLGDLSGHLHLDKNSVKTKAYSLLIRANYALFGLLADEIVVFDEHLKSNLSRYVSAAKITALPHPNNGKPLKKSKNAIKKELGLDPDTIYIMYCGYVTWYKGADWLINTFKKIRNQIKSSKKVRLIVAGGASSSLVIDPKYMRYFRNIEKNIGQSRSISITGVLSEQDYPKYIAAADLMVMPYRLMMSSSGPFSYAQKSGTPVIFSSKLEPMTHASDFSSSLTQVSLSPEDLTFDLSTQSFLSRINKTLANPKQLRKMSTFMKILGKKRSDAIQSKTYLSLIRSSKIHNTPRVFPNYSPSSR